MITILVSHLLRAQTEFPDLQWKFNESGSHYVKATFLNQTWLRYNRSNPGTMVLGDPADQTFDIGLRRTRIQLYGQLTDHVFFYTQFGQNNFNYLAGQNSTNTGNRKVQVFFMMFWANIKFGRTMIGFTSDQVLLLQMDCLVSASRE